MSTGARIGLRRSSPAEKNSQTVELDESGKAVLDHLYNESDPRAYYRVLQALDYRIPGAAQPAIRRLIAARRRARGSQTLKLVDLGCSYGVTGRLLRSGQGMEETYRRYSALARCDRAELVGHDRALLAANRDDSLEIVGLDAAGNACAYALECGAIDAAVIADLETSELSADRAALLAGADLIVSTGFIGYAGARTITRVLDACGESRPWMAHTVMRLFDFAPIQLALADRGYVTRRGARPIYQREFASPAEQAEIVARLVAMGVDPAGLEDAGAIHADLLISRPAEDRFAIGAPEWSELLRAGCPGVDDPPLQGCCSTPEA